MVKRSESLTEGQNLLIPPVETIKVVLRVKEIVRIHETKDSKPLKAKKKIKT